MHVCMYLDKNDIIQLLPECALSRIRSLKVVADRSASTHTDTEPFKLTMTRNPLARLLSAFKVV